MTIFEMKSWLKEFGWSQSKLASKLGVSPNTVSRWETIPEYAAEYIEMVATLKHWHDSVFK